PGWERIEVAGEPGWIAFEGPVPLPRLFLPERTLAVERRELARAFAALDAAETLLVVAGESPAGLGALPPPGGEDRLAIAERRDGRYRVAARLAGERVVATSLLEPEGWRVEAAGR